MRPTPLTECTPLPTDAVVTLLAVLFPQHGLLHVVRSLRETLATVRANAIAQTLAAPSMGLCANWTDALQHVIPDKRHPQPVYPLVSMLAMGLPDHSGRWNYPVGVAAIFGSDAWRGDFLASRLALIDHIDAQLAALDT